MPESNMPIPYILFPFVTIAGITVVIVFSWAA
jgi:hypothetical protein